MTDPDPRPKGSSTEAGRTSTPGPDAQGESDPLRRSRTSGAWVGVLLLAALITILIVFVAQNTQTVEVSFLGWDGETPLAVALMIAAVTGMVLVGIAGGLRLFQIRRRVRRVR